MGLILQQKNSYLFYSGFSLMILEKRKLNLLIGFVICSNSCNCSTSHNLVYLYILDREDKDRIELGTLIRIWARGHIFDCYCFYFTVSVAPSSQQSFTLFPQSIVNRFFK